MVHFLLNLGMRTLAVTSRYFKDKELFTINKIAEHVRG
jgi:hypothetical protein